MIDIKRYLKTLRSPSRETETRRWCPLSWVCEPIRDTPVTDFLWPTRTASKFSVDRSLRHQRSSSFTDFSSAGVAEASVLLVNAGGMRPPKRGGWDRLKSCRGICPNSKIWISYMWRVIGSRIESKSTEPVANKRITSRTKLKFGIRVEQSGRLNLTLHSESANAADE